MSRFMEINATDPTQRRKVLNSGLTRSTPLQYPLKDDNGYKATLSFQVVDEEKHRVKFTDDLAKQFTSVPSIALGGLKGVGNILSAVTGIGDGAERIKELTGANDGATQSAIKTGHTLTAAKNFGKIKLYLPTALNIQDAVSYSNTAELGRIGEKLEDSLNTGGDGGGVSETVERGVSAAGGIGIALLGGNINPEVANIISQKLLSKVSQEASLGLALATQTTLNPNVRTMFQSVPIRQFAFQFTLIATSQAEAKVIENIITQFRTELYPEKLSVAGYSYGYRYPRRFLIKAQYKNKEFPNIKFLPTYLQSFNAVYNPNGMGFHKDGRFTEVAITMNFSESRALGKQDIEAGY